MNILIIGSGAIGISLGASMISQGAEVSFYARGKTADALKTEGIERTGIFEHLKYDSSRYEVYTSYNDISDEKFDYIFVSVKTTSNKDISKDLNDYRNILKKNAKIIIFQNGFANDEAYLKYFEKDEVYCARVITGFNRPERNISEITVHTQPLLLGSLQDVDVSCLNEISLMINNSGIPSETTKELSKYLWDKMLYNCTLNPLGAILGVNYGKLTENDYTIELMNKLIEEIFSVMKASGYSSNWKNAEDYKEIFYTKLVPDTYNHNSSTLQDIRKKQATEIDTLTGKVIQLAQEYDVEVPVNKVIYNQVKALESYF